jgi:VIT1/CCC1 family predicted Fe2+/Mn2+ transporter
VTGGTRHDSAADAKLIVLVVELAWGFNWVAGRIILTALPPWAMRMVGIGLGTLTLFAGIML